MTVLDFPKSRVGAKLVDIYRMDTTPRRPLNKKFNNFLKIITAKKEKDDQPKKTARNLDDFLWDDEKEED